jgi:hypothetical protein
MTSLRSQLAAVQVRDIIHGTYPGYTGGQGSAICLVYEVTVDAIHTRAVTTQYVFVFDRQTGIATGPDGTAHCCLDSIAQLPPKIHSAMLEIDRKYRLLDAPEGGKLLRNEMDALLFVARYYPDHRLDRNKDGPSLLRSS